MLPIDSPTVCVLKDCPICGLEIVEYLGDRDNITDYDRKVMMRFVMGYAKETYGTSNFVIHTAQLCRPDIYAVHIHPIPGKTK
jgi:hypothetical protein